MARPPAPAARREEEELAATAPYWTTIEPVIDGWMAQ
jgi:hypothetical protein